MTKQDYNYGEDRDAGAGTSSYYGRELDAQLSEAIQESIEHRDTRVEIMGEVLKGDDTRKSKINTLGRSILEKKYMSADDKSPEDLFWRVAKVCSIPDVVDWMQEHHKNHVKEENGVISSIINDVSAIFVPYTAEFNASSDWVYGRRSEEGLEPRSS